MEKYAVYLLLGIVLLILGVINYGGNISTIHWYNRRRVSAADTPKYGKCMGIGTMICGISLLITVFLECILKNRIVDITVLIGFAIGLAFLLYGQFKYNKGLF